MKHIYHQLIAAICILLLLLLAGFQWIWVGAGSASSIMNQTGLQRARAQAIAKDAMILAYRPDNEHAQAIAELQNTLPRFEQTQRGLVTGDASLQLPARVPEDIAQLVASTQSDFTSIDTAAAKLLASHGRIDPIQVDIIAAHEHTYTLAMSGVVNAWQARIDGAFLHLYWIETGIVTVLIVAVAGQYLLIVARLPQ